MSTVIKIENLSKSYRLGEVGTGTISHDLNRFFARIRGKEDPYAKVGSVNDRTKAATKGEVVNALSNINLEIHEGEVLGIIGKNGAGKSTLLKILSRITAPTTGSYKIKGRMASLLEVGTGFHPEMTGRENIYMNGTIMGMRKREIDAKLEEIVEFAGVAKYIDTPVKRYSSGMTVRLGFSVAAHLNAEILVVDEVLAVGDAEFQKKAIGKMQDVSRGQGRTVLFVSHNMAAVQNLCNSGVILKNGCLNYSGVISDVISEYLSNQSFNNGSFKARDIPLRKGNQILTFDEVYIENIGGQIVEEMFVGDSVCFVFKLRNNTKNYLKRVNIGFSIHNYIDDNLCVLYSAFQNRFFDIKSEYTEVRCLIKDFNLSPGNYNLKGRIECEGEESDWPQDNLSSFNVVMGNYYKTGHPGFSGNCPIMFYGDWILNND